MIEEPIHITDVEFEEKVLQSDLPVIVYFWAPWCGPCRMVGPILEKVAAEYAGELIVAKINVDEDYEWASKFGVQGIPTMLFMHNGHLHDEQVGAVPEKHLREIVEEFLHSDEKAHVQ
jgi:thioredoxin 1